MKNIFKFGCLGVAVFFAIIVIALIIDISNDDEQAIEKAKEEEQQKEAAAKEKEETENIIADFDVISKEMVSRSNGVIKDVTINKESNYFWIRVYVDESTWARSNESEKLSFSTTIGTVITDALSPHSSYVDIMSATNRDVLATQKTFGGWKIKR